MYEHISAEEMKKHLIKKLNELNDRAVLLLSEDEYNPDKLKELSWEIYHVAHKLDHLICLKEDKFLKALEEKNDEEKERRSPRLRPRTYTPSESRLSRLSGSRLSESKIATLSEPRGSRTSGSSRYSLMDED